MIPSRRLPTTVTILPTYHCTAACENCCFGSHPGVTERIPLDRILSYVDQAAALGTVGLLVFSGGECFTLENDLVIAIARATERGLGSRCVTNGYWATTDENAYARLEPLARAGLRELNLSTGDFHQRYVRPANIVNGAIAGIRLGLRVVIVVESRKGRGFSAEHLTQDTRLAELLADPRLSDRLTLIESPWMSMDEQQPVDQNRPSRISKANLHLRGGCDSVLNTIVVTPAEQLGACCGLTREQIPEMHVGSLRDASIAELYETALADFLKIWIFVEGPEHILAWAAEKDPSIEWEDRYSHHCDACRAMYHDPRVRQVIRSHYLERMDDILLRFGLLNASGSIRLDQTLGMSGTAQTAAPTLASRPLVRLEAFHSGGPAPSGQ